MSATRKFLLNGPFSSTQQALPPTELSDEIDEERLDSDVFELDSSMKMDCEDQDSDEIELEDSPELIELSDKVKELDDQENEDVASLAVDDKEELELEDEVYAVASGSTIVKS